MELLKEMDFPEELVVNTDVKKLESYIGCLLYTSFADPLSAVLEALLDHDAGSHHLRA